MGVMRGLIRWVSDLSSAPKYQLFNESNRRAPSQAQAELKMLHRELLFDRKRYRTTGTVSILRISCRGTRFALGFSLYMDESTMFTPPSLQSSSC